MPFPSPNGCAEIAETHFMTGGEALNSAIGLMRPVEEVLISFPPKTDIKRISP
jgi:hypothetical protein